MKRIVHTALVIWLASVILDGPLRYLLTVAGVPEAVYVRDLLLLFVAGILLITTIMTLRLDVRLIVALTALLYCGILGLWHGLGTSQVLFGFKLFLPGLIGLMIVPLIGMRPQTMLKVFRIGTPVVLLGVLVDVFVELPWAGFTYEVAGQTLEASRAWSMSGLPRLAGFSRASFEVAAQLVCLVGLYFLARAASPRIRRSGQWLDWMLVGLSMVSVFLTTSRTALIVVALLALGWVMRRMYRSSQMVMRPILKWSARSVLVLLLAYAVLPPVAAVSAPGPVAALLRTNNAIINVLTASYADRIERMWPKAFDLLDDGYGLLTGRGLGAIGTAQVHFDPANYNAADNLFVYLTVTSGAIVVILLIVLLARLIPGLAVDSIEGSVTFMIFLIACGFGATMNVIESASLSMALGLCLSLLSRVPPSGAGFQPASPRPEAERNTSASHASRNRI